MTEQVYEIVTWMQDDQRVGGLKWEERFQAVPLCEPISRSILSRDYRVTKATMITGGHDD